MRQTKSRRKRQHVFRRRYKPSKKDEWFSRVENCRDFWMDLFSKLTLSDILEISKKWNGVHRWFNEWTGWMGSQISTIKSPFDFQWKFPLENSYRMELNQRDKHHILIHRVFSDERSLCYGLIFSNANHQFVILDPFRDFKSTSTLEHRPSIKFREENYSTEERYIFSTITISDQISSYKRNAIERWFRNSSFDDYRKHMRVLPDSLVGNTEWLNIVEKEYWTKGKLCPFRWVSKELFSLFPDVENINSWVVQNDIGIACEEIGHDENHLSFEYWCWADLKNHLYLVCHGNVITRISGGEISVFCNLQSEDITSFHVYDHFVYFIDGNHRLWKLDLLGSFSTENAILEKQFSRKSRLVGWKNDGFAIIESESNRRYTTKNFACWVPSSETGNWFRFYLDTFCIEFHPWLNCFCLIKNFDGSVKLLKWGKESSTFESLGSFEFDLKALGFEFEKTLFSRSNRPVLSKHCILGRCISVSPFQKHSDHKVFLEF